MAFGGLRGTLTGNGTSIAASNAIAGSVAVSVGDLVFAVLCQQTALTATTASDNLGNTYTAQNAGTLSTNSGRAYWSRVTNAGTLTNVDVVATSSANNWCGFAVVIEGPFISSPLDRNPANLTADTTTPFTCPATTALSQAVEVVIGWIIANGNAVFAATSPNLLGGNVASATLVRAAIGYQAVSSTSSVSPAFTSGTAPTSDVLGTASFMADTSKPFNQVYWPTAKQPVLSFGLTDQAIWALEIPFNLTDWSRSKVVRSVIPAPFIYNPNLFVPVVIAAPFFQDEWSPARRITTEPPFSDQAIWSFEIAFKQLDWTRPKAIEAAKLHPFVYNPNLYTVVEAAPFFLDDWSRPFPIPSQPLRLPPYNINLTPPFTLDDWSRPFTPNAPKPWIPYNLALLEVTEAPFALMDWSRAHSISAPLPPPQPYNPLIFSEIPFARLDWSRPYTLWTTVPFAQPYNPLLFSEVPFIQDLWPPAARAQGVTFTITYNLPLLTGTVESPFNQLIWTAAPRLTVPPAQPQPYNPLLYTVAEENPFFQTSWPTTVRLRGSVGIEQRNPLTFLDVPFRQLDWLKPKRPAALSPQAPPYNILTFSEVPFEQPNWPQASTLHTQPTPIPYNQNLYVAEVAAPFLPVDWSKPFFPKVVRADPTGTNINLFTNPIPFIQDEWARPQPLRPPSSLITFNPNLYSEEAPAPFIPVDWSRPFAIRFAQPIILPTNINLFTNPLPFNKSDWSRSQAAPIITPPAQPYNPLIFSGVPFYQTDWSKTRPLRAQPTPFAYNPNLVTVTAAPFIPIDFSKPTILSAPRTHPAFNPNLFTNPIPFLLDDWSRAKPVEAIPPALINLNIALTTVVTQNPFVQDDWSRPQRLRATQLPFQPYRISLYTGRPFSLSDWSRPSRPYAAHPQPNPRNLNIFTPIPFTLDDWSRSKRVPLYPPPFHRALNLNLVPVGVVIYAAITEGAAAADAYSTQNSPSGLSEPQFVRDPWDRDEWGNFIPGGGVRGV